MSAISLPTAPASSQPTVSFGNRYKKCLHTSSVREKEVWVASQKAKYKILPDLKWGYYKNETNTSQLTPD